MVVWIISKRHPPVSSHTLTLQYTYVLISTSSCMIQPLHILILDKSSMYGNRENAPSYNKSCQWFEYKETESFLNWKLSTCRINVPAQIFNKSGSES